MLCRDSVGSMWGGSLVRADCLWQAPQVQPPDVPKSDWETAADSPEVTEKAGCNHLTF